AIPLKIIYPRLKVRLVESNSKKVGLYIDGNHDITDKEKLYHQNLPMLSKDDISYSLKIGDFGYLLGLSYNHPIDAERLDKEIENYNSSLWKISFFHKPIFNSNLQENDLNLDWHLKFNKFKMDLIFTAHNHFYERIFVENLNYLSCPPISGTMKPLSEFQFTNRTITYDFIRGYMICKMTREELTVNVIGYNKNTKQIFNLDNLTIFK
ncbi:MAG: hypothetical protein ACFFAO_19075, partial [Candidatus Hermodarchaeota archaeon]